MIRSVLVRTGVFAVLVGVMGVSVAAQSAVETPAPTAGVGAPIVPSRLDVVRQLEVQFPMPEQPYSPIAPARPGAGVPTIIGLLAGAGAFVGTATLCGKQDITGDGPYGTFVNGKYVAPGAVLAVAANGGCLAGSAAGAALTTTFLVRMVRSSGYKKDLAQYEKDLQQYPVQKAAFDRAVAQRQQALDSAATVVIAEAERKVREYREAELTRIAASNPRGPARTCLCPLDHPAEDRAREPGCGRRRDRQPRLLTLRGPAGGLRGA